MAKAAELLGVILVDSDRSCHLVVTVKATRFPGEELRWDKATLAFSNHEQATQTLVRRS